MNSVFVYCEIEEGIIADVSLELLTKGRTLATELGVKLEAIVLGSDLKGVEKQVFPYGVDVLWLGDDKRLAPYTTLPHTSILVNLFKQEKPQIAFMGASSIGRDLGPRVSSALHSGLTADCTSLEIGDYEDKKNNKIYHNLLYQIRPAFGGNIVATIVNPDCRPQMARRSDEKRNLQCEPPGRNQNDRCESVHHSGRFCHPCDRTSHGKIKSEPESSSDHCCRRLWCRFERKLPVTA